MGSNGSKSRYPANCLLLEGRPGAVQDYVEGACYGSSVSPQYQIDGVRSNSLNSKIDFFQSTWKSIYANARPTLQSISFKDALAKAQAVSSKEVATYGIIAAEILGFWTVGEIIGRQKIVGYRHKIESHHH